MGTEVCAQTHFLSLIPYIPSIIFSSLLFSLFPSFNVTIDQVSCKSTQLSCAGINDIQLNNLRRYTTKMPDWLSFFDIFPSLSQITTTLVETMKAIIDFAITPLIDFVYAPFIDLLHIDPQAVLGMMKSRMYIILHRLLTKLGEIGERYTPTDPRYYMGRWEMGTIGRLILLGCEMWIGILVLWDVMAHYSIPAGHSTSVRPSAPAVTVSMENAATTHDSGALVPDQRSSHNPSSSSNSGISSQFSSASTSRTNSTNTTTTTTNTTPDANIQYQNQTMLPNQNQHQARPPPDRVLQQYIYPKYSSNWPPYYLQAFDKAQESLLKEGNIHVDAPTSSGTRNNKDGCVGKIVLDRKVVRRDVKDGVVGYCEGITGTVSLMLRERLWLINRGIGRGLYGDSRG